MSVLSRLRGQTRPVESRYTGMLQLWKDGPEALPTDFASYIADGYKANGVVFAVILARLMLFCEASFLWRDRRSHEMLDWTPELGVLDRPWPNGTTGDLLARMEQDVSLAGNSYTWRQSRDRLVRLRPDWIQIISVEVEVGMWDLAGYLYTHGGTSGDRQQFIAPEDMAHYAPVPDPDARYRGMSWLTPVAREIVGDSTMSRHKNLFFNNAATPNLIVTYERQLQKETRDMLREEISRRYEGYENAYKTMVLDGGADVTVAGVDLGQLSFAALQAAGENRIAVAAGVPAVVVGLKEGLQAATYSNYAQALRRFADLTIRPLWRSASGALESLFPTQPGRQLWYDDRDIPALAQDAKDQAEITRTHTMSMAALARVGYDLDGIAGAVVEGTLDDLDHTGAIPVTLYPEGQDPRNTGRPPED